LRDRLPEILSGFLYTNTADHYTWRASNPRAVSMLAEAVRKKTGGVDLVLGAAHGSIRPAILLSCLLDCELYFLRYSMFKRDDARPIVSQDDLEFLAPYRERPVLLFDEDVAKGKTLRSFSAVLGEHLTRTYTGAALRFFLAPYTPDFVGDVFYD